MLLALVATFRTRSLRVVERLSLAGDDIARALVADGAVRGAVTLATCNRFELYLDVADEALARDAATAAIAARTSMAAADAAAALDRLSDDDAVRHLCAVASSLDSMVVGEQEISGQVRRALRKALDERTATGVLTRAFENALRIAREVVGATGIGSSTRSVASVALDIAERTTDLADARVLLVGTGQLAASGVRALRRRGASIIGVFSPSGRARDFGELFGIEPLGLADLHDALAHADVIYACSGGEGVVLSAQQLAAARAGRPWPLTVIDLALHRDLDPAAAELSGVTVVSLDDVRAHAPRENPEAHSRALDIVAAGARELSADLRSRAMI
ncbi:MAG: glutamyl-tRNA reductase [Actinomycetes bacterium]